MKAMVIQQYGGPEELTLADLPIPQPESGEVRVKVHAVSINPVDYKRRQNWPSQKLLVVLGWDVSGLVDALGEGVTDLRVGDAVIRDDTFSRGRPRLRRVRRRCRYRYGAQT